MVDDRNVLTLIRQAGGRVNVPAIAWRLGVDEAEVFAALESLVDSGEVVATANRKGMIAS